MSPIFDFKKHRLRTLALIAVIFFGAFAVTGIVGIQIWEYSNSNAFCANMCHNVHPEEPVAFQDGYHGSINCVECHMGRQGMIPTALIKVTHLKHIPAVVFGNYHRPVAAETQRPDSETCEKCHSPQSLHGDTLKEIKFYLPDENNTEKRRFMLLRTGGREKDKGLNEGAHWHIANRVEFVAADEHKQDITWVKAITSDGESIEYVKEGLSSSSDHIDVEEVHVMECTSCHNRLGHPFPTPDKAIDDALADGRLSTDLPYLKKETLELLSGDFANQEEALAAAGEFAASYTAEYPAAAAQKDAVEAAVEFSQTLAARLFFEKPGITWESFPNNSGHKYFPGCFRCHDGKHASSDGKLIPVRCSLCHSIPATVGGNEKPPVVPAASLAGPDFHMEPKFYFEHRLLASDACGACHGEIAFGRDDSSGFCSSSACHGQQWAALQPETTEPHPFALAASHAKPACYECHQGEIQPSAQCAGCHDASAPRVHFGAACDDCHSPEGWVVSAAAIVANASKIKHDLKGMDNCLMCHSPAGQIKPAPAATHKAYSIAQCFFCHKR